MAPVVSELSLPSCVDTANNGVSSIDSLGWETPLTEFVESHQRGVKRDCPFENESEDGANDSSKDGAGANKDNFSFKYGGDGALKDNESYEIQQLRKKVEEWEASCQGVKGFVDLNGALFLEFSDHKRVHPETVDPLIHMMWQSRRNISLCYFSHPGEDTDGGFVAREFNDRSSPDDSENTAMAVEALRQYNSKTNQLSEQLEFVSLVRVASALDSHGIIDAYLTFTARKNNGQIATYQAAVAYDWHCDDVFFLILLRDVEKDKILAYMAVPWVAEEFWMKY